MPNDLRVALAQLEPAQNDVAANVNRAVEAIGQQGDCDLIVFPELYLSGISRNGYEDLRIAVEGPELAALARAAKAAGTKVILGAALATASGTANAALAIDANGGLAGSYKKTHGWDTEAESVLPGQRIVPIELDGLKAGVSVCFDLEFPEVARTLALEGADLLVTIAANMEPFGPDHALFARARAVENRLFHVYVNRTGKAEGSNFVGESCVIDPLGRTRLQAGAESELLTFTIPAGEADVDPRVEYLKHRRPAIYSRLTQS
jgi:predicted amidohydrolase